MSEWETEERDDQSNIIEEYRGLVNELFTILLDRIRNAEQELFRMRLEKEREDQLSQMQEMANANAKVDRR